MSAGCTQREASRRAGVNESTGSRWAKGLVENASEGIPSKDALVGDLFKSYIGAETQYKANLAKRIVEMLGFTAPKHAVEDDRTARKPIRDLVCAWWAEANPPMKNRTPSSQHVSADICAQPATHGESATGGSPQASADGSVRSDSPTATDPRKVSDPPPEISQKVEGV